LRQRIPSSIRPRRHGKIRSCAFFPTLIIGFADLGSRYFLLGDRFSNNLETGYTSNDGTPVTSKGTPLYNPTTDLGNAIRDKSSTQAWLDAGAKFCGGTIAGVKSKLGYLKRLGITAVWISPVFRQVKKLETYHGYGVQDFLAIEPRFGTKEELKDLVNTAHSMGLYVILDIIL
jgi:glycosidase